MTEYVYHLTTPEIAAELRSRELPPNAQLVRLDVARHQCRLLERAGLPVAVFRLPAARAVRASRPDGLAMADPQANGITTSEEEVFHEWAIASKGTAADSLQIVGSVRTRVALPGWSLEAVATLPAGSDMTGVGDLRGPSDRCDPAAIGRPALATALADGLFSLLRGWSARRASPSQ